MSLIRSEIYDYAENHSSKEPAVLQELRRETWQKTLAPRMLSGHLQGRLLSLISKLVQPKNILEIGTFTGYSAICLAEGIKKGGKLHTIDSNEELFDFQKKYFIKAGLENTIVQHTGDAIQIIPEIITKFDLVFIDADKKDYIQYYDLIIEKLNKGGVIITDNVLWSGKVVGNVLANDMETMEIMKYNEKIKNDKHVETILLPFRDGISITRKN